MTTYTYATMRGRSLVVRLVERLSPTAKSLRATLGRAWDRVRPELMTVAGLACITAGLFTVSVLAGLIAAGISCFLTDWHATK